MTDVWIAHAGDLSTPSGGTDRVTAFLTGLRRRGLDARVVAPAPDGALPERVDPAWVRTVSTPAPVDAAVARATAVARTARSLAARDGATLQFEHSALAGVGTLLGASSYVLDMHDLAHSRYDHVDGPLSGVAGRGVEWLERRGVARADRVVVVSEYMAETLRRQWDVPQERVTVVPNGYFPGRLPDDHSPTAEAGRVCFLGTLHPKVDAGAVADLCRSPAVSGVTVVGDGALRDRFESLAVRHYALEVTGRLPDGAAFDHLARAAVAINPQEGSELQRSSSPVKLCYYAAMGKPMVVSAGPPLVQRLVGADAAIAADTRSAFVEGVERLLEDTDLAATLGSNAEAVAREWTWEARTERLASIHE